MKSNAPLFHRGDGVVDAAIGGHQHDGQLVIGLTEAAKQFQAIHLGHLQVGDDGGRPVLGDHAQRRAAIRRGDYAITRTLQR